MRWTDVSAADEFKMRRSNQSDTMEAEGWYETADWKKNQRASQRTQYHPGKAGGASGCFFSVGIPLGIGSFPKLKIPHQSHADFCSTDTAGGLDNKKRRYAPRGGVAYRLFLWGYPKGATPHLAHDFAKQSVVCYTLCRRCRENAVAAGEGKGI